MSILAKFTLSTLCEREKYGKIFQTCFFRKAKALIGYYNYTVVLTYLGLLASLGSAASAINGNFKLSMIFMLICGFADMFDGVIARTDKKRSENAKRFGVQIDSLCDMSCFCCLPAVFMLCLCGVSALSLIAGGMIMLSGVIRLGYFNVQEINRELENEGRREYYDGLPVTASALILPPAALLGALLGANWFSPAVMIIAAVLNVTRVKIKKPRGKWILIMLGIGTAIAVLVLVFGGKVTASGVNV